MEIGVESYKDAVMGSPIFFLTNLRNRICERISAESEKAELADYRFNCANTTAQSLLSAISMIGHGYNAGSRTDSQCSIYYLDEGTSALDEVNALDIEANLLGYSTSDIPQLGVIIITHNLRDSIREQLTAVYQL